MARRNRAVARVDVKLKGSKSKAGKQFMCEAILHTPEYKLTAEESTTNMFASVDVVEAKLQAQLKKHKETHNPSKDKKRHSKARRLLGKLLPR